MPSGLKNSHLCQPNYLDVQPGLNYVTYRLSVSLEERLDISVIIPTRDRHDTLKLCLASIKQSKFHGFEVIVVDDYSRDDCSDVVTEFGYQIIRLNKPCGAWYARNKGAELAGGDILAFVDDDMLVQPNTLQRIQYLFSQNHYAAVSGVCGLKSDNKSLVTRYKNLWMFYSYIKSPRDFEWFICGMGAVKRDVFFELKGFDDRFFTRKGGGDLEFGRRLKEAGKHILLDKELQVEHLQHYTLSGLLRNDYKRSRGWFQLAVQKGMILDVAKTLRIANIYPAFILSIPVSMVSFFSLLLSPFSRIFILSTILSALIYLTINFPLFRFFRIEEGNIFLLKAIPLSWIDHVISGFGVLSDGINQLGHMIPTVFSKITDQVNLWEHFHRLGNSRDYS